MLSSDEKEEKINMISGMMQSFVEEYKRQLIDRRITSNDRRIRSLQREDERLRGKYYS